METGTSIEGLIDTCVHPLPRFENSLKDELLDFMEEPWRSRPMPAPQRQFYPAPTGEPPFGEYLVEARDRDGRLNLLPDAVFKHLASIGATAAILLPLTRGLMPEVDFGSAICSATNRWLAEKWLGEGSSTGRFLGSIRVNPEDPEGAIAEIERWISHPRMVQIAVPLEAHKPYGGRQYFKIWETATRYGLPVAVHSDGGAGIDFSPTPNGYPRHFIEYNTMVSMNPFYHLSSLIAEGVFERLPDLKFVFADGGHDMLMPLIWRMDQDWPVSGWQIPWVSKRPSHYLLAHVRFCTARFEGPPPSEAVVGQWEATGQLGELLMFASNYPHWSTMSPSDLPAGLSEPVRRRILGETAAGSYGCRLVKAPRAIARESL